MQTNVRARSLKKWMDLVAAEVRTSFFSEMFDHFCSTLFFRAKTNVSNFCFYSIALEEVGTRSEIPNRPEMHICKFQLVLKSMTSDAEHVWIWMELQNSDRFRNRNVCWFYCRSSSSAPKSNFTKVGCCENFEFSAVQQCANRVDLEKCATSR